jgi:hypothetical protein
MFAYQYPTYLVADASISAAPAELPRLVLAAIPRGPSTVQQRAFARTFSNLGAYFFLIFWGFKRI